MSNNGKKDDPKQASKISSFCHFLYNPENKTVLDRSAGSWAQIGIFYLIFYSCLAGFFAIQLAVFFVTVSADEPSLQSKASLLKGFPGMGFRPQPEHETTLIRFDQGVPESYEKYKSHIQDYLKQYENDKQEGDNFQDCQNLDNRDPQKVCRFLVDDLGSECTWQRDYGYDEGQPCVMVKLNKIYDWIPELYTNATLPDDARELVPEGFDDNYIGLTCEGENPADQENMGPITYFPNNGFHSKYYPYLNQEGYRGPVAFIKFMKPKNGVLIQIWCKAWAKNIYHHRNDRAGSVRFELMVD